MLLKTQLNTFNSPNLKTVIHPANIDFSFTDNIVITY